MVILIDYDNLAALDKKHGVDMVIMKILDSIGVARFSNGDAITVRLYGGWFQGNQMTRRAQGLSASIAAFSPGRIMLSNASGAVSLIVRVALAHSLEADPKKILPDTYRTYP